MMADAFIQTALVSTSATIALILAIAWQEFDHPRHALTWSFAFALAALTWAIGLIPIQSGVESRAANAVSYVVACFATTVNTLGFRQRVGAPEPRVALFGAAGAVAALIVLLALAGASQVVQLAPLNLYNAAMFLLAARTLHGRRQGERAAERVADSGLLLVAMLSFAVGLGLLAAAAGITVLNILQFSSITLLLLPGIIAGIGLFAIILLAADLADQARRLAATDMLTGLLNRRGFTAAADAMIRSARRHGRPLTLVLMDLDWFKRVNDRFGHPAGDRVLCAIAQCMAAQSGARDVLARFGGEEFAIIPIDADLVETAAVVERLRAAVAALDLPLPEPCRITASFGMAALDDQDSGLTGLFKRADQALYRSKTDGRNCCTTAS